jgi:hypothetical protein
MIPEHTGKVVSYDARNDIALVDVRPTPHTLQIGGQHGDGFCYLHQSWDCIYRLEVRGALQNLDWSLINDPTD